MINIMKQGLGLALPNKKAVPRAGNFQELKICDHGTVLALTPLGKGVFMDIEVKRMSPTAIEMLDQLSAVANGSASIIMQPPKISVICWTALPCTNTN